MSDRRSLQWDIRPDRNAYPEGPLAKDKAVYNFTGWEGCHRGSLLLTEQEAEFFRERLTNAAPPPSTHLTGDWESREGCVGAMTSSRAVYFLERFKREEKMLGPHEQWALDFAIAVLATTEGK